MRNGKALIASIAVGLFFVSTIALAQSLPQAGSTARIDIGTIESMQAGTANGKGGLLGTTAGAVGGAALAKNIGSGSGKKVAQVGGGLLGAKVGNRISANRNTQQVVEFIIKLENGQRMSVVQSQETASGFRTGDKVNVITGSDGKAKITRG